MEGNKKKKNQLYFQSTLTQFKTDQSDVHLRLNIIKTIKWISDINKNIWNIESKI